MISTLRSLQPKHLSEDNMHAGQAGYFRMRLIQLLFWVIPCLGLFSVRNVSAILGRQR